MWERATTWAGGTLAVTAAIAMGAYFAVVGLDEADKLAGTIGAFTGLAGLVLAIYGTDRARRSDGPPQQSSAAQSARGAVDSEIHGGTLQGPVTRCRSFGQIALGSSPQATSPPDGPDTSAQR